MKILMSFILGFGMLLSTSSFALDHGVTASCNAEAIETADAMDNSISTVSQPVEDVTGLPSCLVERVAEILGTSSFTTTYLFQQTGGAYIYSYEISPTDKGYIKVSNLTCTADIIIDNDMDGL